MADQNAANGKAATVAGGTSRQAWRRMLVHLGVWARRVKLGRKMAFALTVLATLSGVATYLVLTEGIGGGVAPGWVLLLLNLDLALLLALGTIVARRIVAVWSERRSGGGGARLHGRLVFLFSMVAVTPAILVAVFSALFFNLGVEAWFNERVRTAVHESLAVARAYLDEHTQIIGGDALAMANDINREAPMLARSPQRLSQLVATQAAIRSLPEAIVFEAASGRVLARSPFAFSMEMSLQQIPQSAMDKARSGEVAILTTEDDDRVRALVRLDSFLDTFLYVGRFVDPKVINHMERTSAAVAEYERAERRRSGVEITVSLIFILVALLLLLAAVWVGLTLATQLARPIVSLINAAERVRAGDLSVRVEQHDGSDELASLSRAFNRMTEQIASQQHAVMEANRLLDERRRFTETVLAGVSAGVVGLDADGRIHLPNRSASVLLGIDLENKIGLPLAEVAPEMAAMVDAVRARPERLLQDEIVLARPGTRRILLVRVAPERMEEDVIGYVVTFDDITELVSAQRKAAWADVARRIAHEIKNPLTPIQLSAERLRRKYLKQIQTDPETFTTCVETIVRQVGDIGRMVDEFSAFARMPAPQIKPEDVAGIARRIAFLHANGYPEVVLDLDIPDGPVVLPCDERQVGQALTNILKNAVESIGGREGGAGRIELSVRPGNDVVEIVVSDNGRGLPSELRDRLTEPYVTTRAKGTGLGLAIVKKIMEDHGGLLHLEDRADGPGARARLVFPLNAGTAATAPAEATNGA